MIGPQPQLRRVLTFWPLLLYGLGVIVGAGIYVAMGLKPRSAAIQRRASAASLVGKIRISPRTRNRNALIASRIQSTSVTTAIRSPAREMRKPDPEIFPYRPGVHPGKLAPQLVVAADLLPVPERRFDRRDQDLVVVRSRHASFGDRRHDTLREVFQHLDHDTLLSVD